MRALAMLFPLALFSLPDPAVAAPASEGKIPPELRQFVAKGETILAHKSADLNGDGRRDVVFIVESDTPVDDDRIEDDLGRTLKIAVRSPNGALKLVKESHRVVSCRSCGGSFGDPFEGLSASTKTFSVSHYGGSGWRWTNAFTFNYSKRDDTWQLVRVDESSFHSAEPGKQKSASYLPPRSFGKIDISEFDPENFKGAGKK